MGKGLSKEDISALSKSPNLAIKSSTAKKITVYYNGKDLTAKGKKIAEDIFRVMISDVEVKVREVISQSLASCKNLPKDIVKKLIEDKNSVSLSFITFYEDLSKDDLINILDKQSLAKQKAVAQRKNLSEDISDYIATKCNEEVVIVLVSNSSANIKEKTYLSIVQKYPESTGIKKSLVYRNELPVSIVEKIITSLSEDLKERLISNHELPSNIASDIVEQVKEKATLQISEDYSSDEQIEQLVQQLNKNNRLTGTLVVRAVCTGDLKFFEYALALLTRSTLSEVRKVLFNSNADFMIRNLLRKAFIPNNMFPAVFSALKVINDLKFDCTKTNRALFTHKVIERILSLESVSGELDDSDLKYLISKIT